MWWDSRELLSAGPWRAVYLLFLMLVPAAFFLLPRTLATCSVRKPHLVRAWSYSLVLAPVALGLPLVLKTVMGLVYLVDMRVNGPRPFLMGIGVWVFRNPVAIDVGVLLVCGILWWGCAAKAYLRLPRPWLVGGAMVTVAMLLSVLAVASMPGGAMALARWL
jgi:hypothetical protein